MMVDENRVHKWMEDNQLKIFCPACGEENKDKLALTDLGYSFENHTQKLMNDLRFLQSYPTGYETIGIQASLRCVYCHVESKIKYSRYQRNEAQWKEWEKEDKREERNEKRRKYKSYECNCNQCMPKGQLCDYEGCDKPAKHAFLVGVLVMDTSCDRIYHGCQQHAKWADNEAYKDENDGKSIPGYKGED